MVTLTADGQERSFTFADHFANPMTSKTFRLSSIESYLAYEGDSPEERGAAIREREDLLRRFPHSIMLEMAYSELDYAHRWCWQRLGPMDGSCTQKYSEYKACSDETEHRHTGKWASHWFAKTDYDFGYNEFYFVERADRDLLLAHLSDIHWGEHYLK
jgi:hypothetical protein